MVSCVAMSQTRICESKAELATVDPSGDAARETTPREWPVFVLFFICIERGSFASYDVR